MSQKGPLLAALEGKCPRCRKGDMFQYPLYKISKFHKVHDNCPHCGMQYEIEPGFFYGAMYVSYAPSVGIFLTTAFLVTMFLENPSIKT